MLMERFPGTKFLLDGPQCERTLSPNSLEDREDQELANLIRIYGHNWDLIASLFASVAYKTPIELQNRWARIQYRFENPGHSHPPPNHSTAQIAPNNQTVTLLSCSESGNSMSFVRSRNQPMQELNISSDLKIGQPISHFRDEKSPRWPGQTEQTMFENFSLPVAASSSSKSIAIKRKFHSPPHSPVQRRRNESPNSLSSESHSSPTSLQADIISFDVLNNPLDHPISANPLELPCHNSSPAMTPIKSSLGYNDDFFAVQTPTKTIGESDQQSFHLVSPPSGFGYLSGGVVKSNHTFMKPRVLFHTKGQSTEKLPSGPLVTLAPLVTQNTVSRTSFNAPHLPTSKQGSPSGTAFVATPLQPLKLSSSDSIALSMAKITVWNRMAAAVTASSSTKVPPPVVNPPQRHFNAPQQDSPTPRQTLPFPAQDEPQLCIRRVLQVGLGRKWRRFALSENRNYLNNVRLASRFLGANANDSP